MLAAVHAAADRLGSRSEQLQETPNQVSEQGSVVLLQLTSNPWSLLMAALKARRAALSSGLACGVLTETKTRTQRKVCAHSLDLCTIEWQGRKVQEFQVHQLAAVAGPN